MSNKHEISLIYRYTYILHIYISRRYTFARLRKLCSSTTFRFKTLNATIAILTQESKAPFGGREKRMQKHIQHTTSNHIKSYQIKHLTYVLLMPGTERKEGGIYIYTYIYLYMYIRLLLQQTYDHNTGGIGWKSNRWGQGLIGMRYPPHSQNHEGGGGERKL
jgi:hypothetical protein